MQRKNPDERYRSDIPDNAVESCVSPYRAKGGVTNLERRACSVDEEIVGYRYYDKDGTLAIETPVKDGRKHGMEYTWEDDGDGPYVHLAAPYENGLPHGMANQWAADGALMGTYTLDHGTGFDLWRNFDEHGRLYVAEVHSMKDGYPHGYEWWVNGDQHSVWHEIHWKDGERHGIERMWDHEANLDPGYPKFHIRDSIVDKKTYIAKQQGDTGLPKYLAMDDRDKRSFPEDVLKAMHSD